MKFSEQIGEKRGAGLSTFEIKIMQRILLELFCQYELSSYFRVLPPRETSSNYYEIVAKWVEIWKGLKKIHLEIKIS